MTFAFFLGDIVCCDELSQMAQRVASTAVLVCTLILCIALIAFAHTVTDVQSQNPRIAFKR